MVRIARNKDSRVLAVTAYDKYGVTLLGSGFQNINDGHQYLILDSEYIFMLVSNGIVYSALAVALFSHLIYRTEKSKNRHIVLIYVLIAVYCIFNNGIYNLIFNPFIILISRLEEKSCKSQGENEG